MSNALVNSMKWASFVSLQLETIMASVTNPVISSFNGSNLIIKSIAIKDYTCSSIRTTLVASTWSLGSNTNL